MPENKSGSDYSSALFISFSDQYDWGLNKSRRLGLNCTTDVDEHWRPLFARYFKNLLCYDINKNANASGLINANADLIGLVKRYKPELIIYPCIFDGLVTLDTLTAIRNDGCKIAGLFFDDEIFFDRLTKYLIPYLDYFITASHIAAKRYSEYGIEAICSTPIPMDTAIFRKLSDVKKCFDVTFVGNSHTADRQIMLDGLRVADCNIKTFGGNRSQDKIHYSEMVEIFNQSRINLNFSKHVTHAGELIPQFKGRIFEVTLSGGFLLCEYVPGIEEFFVLDKEIVCFKTVKEAVEKINYYLAHEDARVEIAKNGYARAVRDYSGEVMVNKIFNKISEQRTITRNDKRFTELMALPNDLSKVYSDSYCRWTKALLASSYPLRGQWRKTAGLALQMNIGNHKIRRIILISKLFGDPQLLTGACKWLKWYSRKMMSKWYFLTRRRLRKLKERIVNKNV